MSCLFLFAAAATIAVGEKVGSTPAPPPASSASRDLMLSRIAISGSTIVPRLGSVTRPYVGRRADETTLRDVAAALDRAYAASDVAVYTISLDRLADDGTLHVIVTEGHVESVTIDNGADRRTGALIQHIAARLDRDIGPLSRSVLQRTLRLIADMPGAKVEADMVAGTAPGGVVVRFRIARHQPSANIRFDNDGAHLTGRAQATVSVRLPNIVAVGDTIDMVYAHTLGGRYSAAGLTYSMPIGRNGVQAILSVADVRSGLPTYRLKGRFRSLSGGISYPLHADMHSQFTASLLFEAQNSETDFAGFRLITERLRIARFALSWSRTSERDGSFLVATLSQGLALPGTQEPAAISQRRFTKGKATAGYDRMIGARAVIRSRLLAQYSHDALPSGEGAALGGGDFGRALEPGIVNGDSVFAGSAEFAWAPRLGQLERQWELFGYLDAGRGVYNSRPLFARQQFDLASTGAGVRLSDGRLKTEFSLNRVLHNPYALLGDRWRIRVSASLTFP